jgi:hypothetical protein
LAPSGSTRRSLKSSGQGLPVPQVRTFYLESFKSSLPRSQLGTPQSDLAISQKLAQRPTRPSNKPFQSQVIHRLLAEVSNGHLTLRPVVSSEAHAKDYSPSYMNFVAIAVQMFLGEVPLWHLSVRPAVYSKARAKAFPPSNWNFCDIAVPKVLPKDIL